MTPTAVMKNCPMCKGAGQMPISAMAATKDDRVMCKMCNGTGRVPA